MNWKNEAANDLLNHVRKQEALQNIKDEMATLKFELESLKGVVTDKVPVQGGGSQLEDKQLDNIVKRERLKMNYIATKRLVDLVNKGLVGLDKEEQLVLDRFYLHKTRDHIERLMGELGYEERNIYKIKDRALYKFTISMYGLIDS